MLIINFDDITVLDAKNRPNGTILIVDDEQRAIKVADDNWEFHVVDEPVQIMDDEGADELVKYLMSLEDQYPVDWMTRIGE